MSNIGDNIGHIIFFFGGMATVLIILAAVLIFTGKYK
jgi:hypothetical protein